MFRTGGVGGSAYNPASVAITGGTINSTSIGATTPSTGAFTTLSTTSTSTMGGDVNVTGNVRAGTANAFYWTGSSRWYSVSDGLIQATTSDGVTLGSVQGASTIVATANAATWTHGSISESITLSTSGATTDSTANLLPANSIIEAVVARVTTTITTATDWKLGDATISGRFSAVNAVMTSGSTQVGTVQADQTGTSGPRQVAAAKLRITTTGTPGAGVIRVTVFYRQFVPPTS